MKLKQFVKLIGGLALAFGLPWSILIMGPYFCASSAAPVAYSEEEIEEKGLAHAAYPDNTFYRNGDSAYGRQVYAAEGCVYCHTQMVRPTYAGADMWRTNWGGRDAEGLARETRPQDYVLEEVAPLGYQRIGTDLSNLAYRVTTKEALHQILKDPRSTNPDSAMPAFKHLYKKDPVTGELVPTARAVALVDYLLSLKKDQPIPADS